MANPLSRRSFLKAGLIGTVVLAGAGGLYRYNKKTAPAQRYTLDGDARSALAAIAAVVLKDALSTPQAADMAVTRVQAAIASLPLKTQSEIQDLFALLAFAPARRFAAGISGGWEHADPADIAPFLQSWRFHRFTLLQNAYHALHDLIFGAWYADESTWAAIGYPGPLKTG
jgi:hypothetical protein